MNAQKLNQIVLATMVNATDDSKAGCGGKIGFPVVRDDEYDVLSQYYLAARPLHPDFVVRVPSDRPLNDRAIVDQIVTRLAPENVDYMSNTLFPSFPDGLDMETLRFDALEKVCKEATSP